MTVPNPAEQIASLKDEVGFLKIEVDRLCLQFHSHKETDRLLLRLIHFDEIKRQRDEAEKNAKAHETANTELRRILKRTEDDRDKVFAHLCKVTTP